MLQLDERTWGWLTNPKVKTLGLWLYFEHGNNEARSSFFMKVLE